MNTKNKTDNSIRIRIQNTFMHTCILFSSALVAFASSTVSGFGQIPDSKSNDQLVDQFVLSIGKEIIVFDASNIKQYWIDPSVVCFDNKNITIQMNQKRSELFESKSLKIQLANVNETQNCRIDILTEDPKTSFYVTNNKAEKIAESVEEDNFLDYCRASSVFHLEEAPGLCFNIVFSNTIKDTISIKRIVLSFASNKHSSFLLSPGKLLLTSDDITIDSKLTVPDNDNSFVVSGKNINIFSKKKILVSDNPINYSVTVKNTGNSPATVYIGYKPCTKDGERIQNYNNLYKNHNDILTVISNEKDNKSIIVDSYTEWEEGCFLALNAQEDLSDFPNFPLPDGKIVDVEKIDETHTRITFEKPLKNAIKEGTKVRIQATVKGPMFLFPRAKTLQPGEEKVFSASIQKDDNFFEYSPKALCRGVYYVVPLILVYPAGNASENECQITDFIITY